jgi:8-oxo-dGTP pyrophosphatase MutT (NUDIX family)
MTEPDAADVAGLPVRRAGRVIVLDPGNRILLMRYDQAAPNGPHWSTPGGGLNHGEDYPAAAARELAEETGWSDVVLLGEVLRRSLTMEYGGRLIRQHERLYLARTSQPAAGWAMSRRCTPRTASPPGAGGRWPSSSRPRRWSGPRTWPT